MMRGKTRASERQVRAVARQLEKLGVPLVRVMENGDLDVGDVVPVRVHVAPTPHTTPTGRRYYRFHVTNQAGRHLGWNGKRLFALYPPGLINVAVDKTRSGIPGGKRWETLKDRGDVIEWLANTSAVRLREAA